MNPLQDAFISYGRADSKHFAKRLNDRLVASGYTVWFDFEDIPLGVDYQKQIDDGIEKADNFLFLISPHAVNSKYCGLEVELALKQKKRIIPLLHVEQIDRDTWQERNPAETDEQWAEYTAAGKHSSFPNMHPTIGKINWIYFREGLDDFDRSLQGLIDLLELEKDYIHQHTVLLNEALVWARNQKQTRYLLTGEERQAAEAWLAIRFQDSQPPVIPTDLHYEYITECIKNGNNLMTQVFLSHAEEDKDITEKVRRTLMRSGITTWSYRADIEYGSDFQAAIGRGVEEADNVLFVMSPHSLQSQYCQQELDLAQQLNKRIIVMLAASLEDNQIPVNLRNLQYIDLTDNETEADFLKDEDNLLRVLKQEAAYFNEHKVLLTKALKWERQQRNPCILLQGYELQHALAWRDLAQTKEAYGLTEIQRAFIEASKSQTAAVSPDVFISYSRADSDFARKLNNALQQQRKRTWFDQESIASGADFQQEIYKGIETANFFLFVLSPRAVKSPYCADEVEYAAKLNKRIVTVLHRPVDTADLHPELAKVQWIDFHANAGEFDTNFKELLRVLDTDPVHLKYHTQLLVKAIEWDEKGRREEVLLRGSELTQAEQWMVQAAEKEPSPTVLQGEFVAASRALLEKNQAKEAQRQRNLNRWLTAGIAASLLLTTVATIKTHQAARQRMRAYEATAEATAMTDPIRSLVNGLAAINIGQSWFVRLPQWHQKPLVTTRVLDQANRNSLFQIVTGYEEDVLIASMVFSPDGQTLASSGDDGTIRLWNLQGQLIGEPLRGHQGWVRSVAFSPDGQTLASGGDDGTIQRWSPQGQSIGEPLQGHQGGVLTVAFSPDGQTLVSSGFDRTLRQWDLQGQPVGKPLPGYEGWVVSIAFSPDTQTLVGGGWDGTLRRWDAQGQPIGEPLLGHQGWVLSVAFSPDGQTLASGGEDGTIRLWDSEGQPIRELLQGHQGGVVSVAFSPDGQTLVSGGVDGTIRLWNYRQGQPIGEPLQGHQGRVHIALSPDGRTLASGGNDGTILLWNRQGNPIGVPLQIHRGGIDAITFSLDGQTLASRGFDGNVRWWNPQGNPIGGPLPMPGFYSVALSPDGQILASGGFDGTVRRWDPQGNPIGEPLQGHEGLVYAVAFSPDGQILASGGEDGTIRRWDPQGNPIGELLQGHEDLVLTVAFSPDGQTLASGGFDGTVRRWDPQGRPIGEPLQGHQGRVESVAFSPDGQTLVSSGVDGTIRRWDAQGQPIGEPLQGHQGRVESVTFSPDGQTLASGGDDGTIRLWDPQGQPIVEPLQGHAGEVNAVAFSPDGQTLASGGDDGATLWPIELVTGGFLEPTCRRLRAYLLARSQSDAIAREARRTCDRYQAWE